MLFVAATLLSSAFLLQAPAMRTLPAARSAAVMAAGNDAIDFPDLDGSEVRVGIIRARWHDSIGNSLVDGVKAALKECGVPEENIFESEVPGSFELPLASRYLALSGTVDAVVPIGVLIKGARARPAARAARRGVRASPRHSPHALRTPHPPPSQATPSTLRSSPSRRRVP